MAKQFDLAQHCESKLGEKIIALTTHHDQCWITVAAQDILAVAKKCRDGLGFEQLLDVVGVDYAQYGDAEWKTDQATGTGFSRAADRTKPQLTIDPDKRFAVIYHLLSLKHNARLSIKCFVDTDMPRIQSLVDLWPCANWHEREVFDMFGVVFDGHPDLRRILTDYGFIGHPFRKDFPLNGHVEMRYDENEGRVIYGPVEIEPRTLVARVIRQDNRYGAEEAEA